MALSVDDAVTTLQLIDKHHLSFVVGVAADAIAAAAAENDDPRHLQSTGFVLDPSGTVIVSVCPTGAIGRVPGDVAGLVRYVREHAA